MTRPLSVDDFEDEARERLQSLAYDYIAGGAGDEWTLAENRRSFERWVLRPRVLVDCSIVELGATVLGQEVSFPVLVAPTALHRLVHPDGELATARATGAAGTVMVVSTISTVPLEEIAEVEGPKWFQLYVMQDRSLTERLVQRAHAAGYGAIVVTVDTPWLGRRLRDERNDFRLPPGVIMANLEGLDMANQPVAPGSGLGAFFAAEHSPSLTWKDLEWLRSIAPLPLVLKGILTGEDARLAAEAGVNGIVVSNHGGRQLDGAPASLDALPEVVEAVAGRCEVFVDGGVRRGTDVLKALGLGARAVLVGRPVLWGLAVDGEAGVRAVLTMLRDELAMAMALAGRTSIPQIDPSLVARAPGNGSNG